MFFESGCVQARHGMRAGILGTGLASNQATDRRIPGFGASTTQHCIFLCHVCDVEIKDKQYFNKIPHAVNYNTAETVQPTSNNDHMTGLP